MLNQRLQQKLLQKLSPQQILLMKLLQIHSMALEQRIKQEIEENPALEEIGSIEDDSNDPVERDSLGDPQEQSFRIGRSKTPSDQGDVLSQKMASDLAAGPIDHPLGPVDGS